jgi:ferritin-like metal-binding protein YciE
VQFLNEAYQKEAELEADLTAHIGLTQKAPYRKRLEQHLKETRDHKRRVASRIKALGGQAASGVQAPGVPAGVGELVGKGVAAVKGQVGVARAAVTEQAETHLRNAREEYREEHIEIGMYKAIQALAEQVGDRDTARLAKDILRDEQKMAAFLERQIVSLVADVVRAEIPRDQRAGGGRRRKPAARRKSTSRKSTSRKSTSSKSPRKATARKKPATRKSTTRKASSSRKRPAKKRSRA